MSRGLTAPQIALLEQQEIRVETLLELYLINNGVAATFYYTSGDFEVTTTTATSGGAKTFKSRSFVSNLGSVNETYEIQPINFDIVFSRISDGGADDDFLSNLNSTIIRSRVVINKLFRNLDYTSGGVIQTFDGQITGLDVVFATNDINWILRCSNDFGALSKRKGLSTADCPGALRDRTIAWGRFYRS